MPRPQRKEINFTKDSILSLMQEIYNELVEQRQTAIRIQNKMLSMLKDPEDMTTIGPVIEKQQKIVNDCVEKKISLSKLPPVITIVVVVPDGLVATVLIAVKAERASFRPAISRPRRTRKG